MHLAKVILTQPPSGHDFCSVLMYFCSTKRSAQHLTGLILGVFIVFKGNCISQRWNTFCLSHQYPTWNILYFSEYYHNLWLSWNFQLFPYETRRQTGKAILLRAMLAHQIFFIRIVHLNETLGSFDKPAFREQSFYDFWPWFLASEYCWVFFPLSI